MIENKPTCELQMSAVFIVIPTYNEKENVQLIIKRIHAVNPDFQIIVVDDNSPDGTADAAESLNGIFGNVIVIKRVGKSGIGSAVREGLKYAIENPDCRNIVTIDADFAHSPEDIPRLLVYSSSYDIVQGSRYVPGGKVVGWRLNRIVISRTANFLYRFLFNLKQKEVTTFFRVYSRDCAETVVQMVKANKHEFGLASALCIKDRGFKLKEVPIVCANRTSGKSKIKFSDLLQSLHYLAATFIKRLKHKYEY